MTDTVMLTEGLLEALADRWRIHEVPILSSLRPGLTDAEMDELTEPLGITLPGEARTWWGWHDGATYGDNFGATLGPNLTLGALAEAVRSTLEIREVWRGIDGELDPAWSPTWLRMSSSGETVVLECGGEASGPVPVRDFRYEEPESGSQGVPSLGSLVSLYIEAFDRGVWAYDASQGRWRRNPAKIRPEIRHLSLI